MLSKGKKFPRRYLEYRIMREMHWSYIDLLSCPDDVFYQILRYINTEAQYADHLAKEG